MLRYFAAIAILTVASTAFADDKDKPKPNTLTPKEIADGWILLFDGETTFGWKTDPLSEGKEKPEITVKDGVLIVGGNSGMARATTRFHLFELRGEYRAAKKGAFLAVTLRGPQTQAGVADDLPPTEGTEWRPFTAYQNSKELVLRTGRPPDSRIGGVGFIPSRQVDVGFRLGDSDARIELRNLKLRPLESKPLFTGKNLDGWKVNAADPKRMASKWEVTKEGELSVKNGPGDLVTEKEFDNFVLQLECKTKGKALNSGIFFRCIPGQYQNGYEAQIQNAFVGEDRTKPVDFGTGAIYRRVAARKVVSNDNEWFTMTVVADGKHISTWVNGYQTVDWTDDRKEDENPRKGYRAAKGPLSIQGHDPTTDILFRNIRIAELPK
jgi:hypothetical protein